MSDTSAPESVYSASQRNDPSFAAPPIVQRAISWASQNWDPDLSVGEWWRLMGEAGWSLPQLPTSSFGQGATADEAAQIAHAFVEFGCLPAPSSANEAAALLAAPTISTHGSRDQIERHVRDIATGRRAWCQLFSEPQAGSDLANVTTRARQDGDSWIVNGQKVWTSDAMNADMGLLLARTTEGSSGREGLTYFLLDLHQPGVDIRPLTEMTGRTIFSEVFLDDAIVSDDNRLGDVGAGWAVARTTLTSERAGLAPGAVAAAASTARPGMKANELGRRVGDVAVTAGTERSGPALIESAAETAGRVARARNGGELTPTDRMALIDFHITSFVARAVAVRAVAAEVPASGNIGKLLSSKLARQAQTLLALAGPHGLVVDYSGSADISDEVACWGSELAEAAIFAPATSIYGGTDQIQRNIIAERVLGLPRDTPAGGET